MTPFAIVKADITASAKWSAILFLPTAVFIVLIFGVLGGIHSDGKLLFLIALAPYLGLHSFIDDASPLVMWTTIVIVEWLYFFLFVALVRALHLHTGTAKILNRSIPYLKARPPKQS